VTQRANKDALYFRVLFFRVDFLEDDVREDELRAVPPPDERAELFFFEALRDDLRGGTLPPSRRASERPMAIACFLLVTLRPEPLFSVPRLRLCIALFTFADAFLPYLAMRCSSRMIGCVDVRA
jgi:hypothetical protein